MYYLDKIRVSISRICVLILAVLLIQYIIIIYIQKLHFLILKNAAILIAYKNSNANFDYTRCNRNRTLLLWSQERNSYLFKIYLYHRSSVRVIHAKLSSVVDDYMRSPVRFQDRAIQMSSVLF